jgi:hypothetical protein
LYPLVTQEVHCTIQEVKITTQEAKNKQQFRRGCQFPERKAVKKNTRSEQTHTHFFAPANEL